MSKQHKDKAPKNDKNLPQNELHTEPITSTEVQSEHTTESETNEQDEISKQLEDLQNNYNELNEKYLRLFSEFDNYRKRTLKEKIELSKTASSDVIKAILPVVDDFERAINNFPENDDNGHLEGVKLIYNNLRRILEQQGLEEIKALGEVFDTDFHEAITHLAAPSDEQKGKVLDVIKKGYSLNGKIIRFAQVIVGS